MLIIEDTGHGRHRNSLAYLHNFSVNVKMNSVFKKYHLPHRVVKINHDCVWKMLSMVPGDGKCPTDGNSGIIRCASQGTRCTGQCGNT